MRAIPVVLLIVALEAVLACGTADAPLHFVTHVEQAAYRLEHGVPHRLPIDVSVTEYGYTLPRAKIIRWPHDGPIYGAALNGDVTFHSDAGLARVVLLARDAGEHLVFESYSLLVADNHQSVEIAASAAETKLLNGVRPISLRVELVDATMTIDSVSILLSLPLTEEQIGLEKRRMKREQHDARIRLLNRQIPARGMAWFAGETPLSMKTYSELKEVFEAGGMLPSLQGYPFYTAGTFELRAADSGLKHMHKQATKTSMVSRFDWRERHGANDPDSPYYDGDQRGSGWATPPKNQGECGSCWAHAVAGTAEANVNLYYNRHIDLDLSEQYLMECSDAPYTTGRGCGGGNPRAGVRFLTEEGIVEESCFPYSGSNAPSCLDSCSTPSERIRFAAARVEEEPLTQDELKRFLVTSGPLLGEVKSWFHDMNMVGFDTENGRMVMIFKNSYGLGEGENGFIRAKIALDDYYSIQSLKPPVTSLNFLPSDIRCLDLDRDGYYNWGTGDQPSTCPESIQDEADCDDSDNTLGPMLEDGSCATIDASTTPDPPTDPAADPEVENPGTTQPDPDSESPTPGVNSDRDAAFDAQSPASPTADPPDANAVRGQSTGCAQMAGARRGGFGLWVWLALLSLAARFGRSSPSGPLRSSPFSSRYARDWLSMAFVTRGRNTEPIARQAAVGMISVRFSMRRAAWIFPSLIWAAVAGCGSSDALPRGATETCPNRFAVGAPFAAVAGLQAAREPLKIDLPTGWQLPFPAGESWLPSPAHSDDWEYPNRPRNSVDFSDGYSDYGDQPVTADVVASAPGKVQWGCECWLEITHDDGWTSTYYHMDPDHQYVDSGDSVEANQPVGRYADRRSEAVCCGGGSDYQHLHWSIWKDGDPVSVEGLVLSGWTVHAGNSNYDEDCDHSYFERDGDKVCPFKRLPNEGTASSNGPQVVLSVPAGGQVDIDDTGTATVTVVAQVTNGADPVEEVTLRVDETPEGSPSSSAPHQWTLELRPGTYTLDALASDSEGREGQSESVAVIVRDGIAPVVLIAAPASSGAWPEGTVLQVRVNAQDNGTGIDEVVLLVDGERIAPARREEPFEWEITLPVGEHEISVTASDRSSNVATAEAVTVTILADSAVPRGSAEPTDLAGVGCSCDVAASGNHSGPGSMGLLLGLCWYLSRGACGGAKRENSEPT